MKGFALFDCSRASKRAPEWGQKEEGEVTLNVANMVVGAEGRTGQTGGRLQRGNRKSNKHWFQPRSVG